MNAGETVFSCLDRFADKRLIDSSKSNLWKAVSYRSSDFAGVMLGNGGGQHPVPLEIRLNKKGAYRVFLGLYNGWSLPQVRIRLSRDLCCQRVVVSEHKKTRCYDISATIYEVFWKEADLTGQNLFLESSFTNAYPSALAYIRLESIDKLESPEKKESPHSLFITEDGHDIFGLFPHSRPEDLLESFENNVPEDRNYVQGLIWGNGVGDVCNYPTETGNYFPADASYSLSRHNFYQNTRLWRKKGWDSMELVKKYAGQRNWEFQVYIRMQAFTAPFPFDRMIHSKFFHHYPQYHCLDRSGRRVARLSYAYPEVQEHMLGLISEILQYRPDGICLCFTRGVPLVLYEPIMVEGFEKAYGVDPRKLPEVDKRWTDYQSEVVTSFIRKAKTITGQGRRLSVIVPGLKNDCKRWGLDVAVWVKECLVDDVFPFGQYFDKRDVHRFDAASVDFNYFDSLSNREQIRLIPMAVLQYPGALNKMRSYLRQGADGYAAWDGISGNRHVSDISLVSVTVNAKESAAVPVKRLKVLSLSGFRHDRYHVFEGL